MTTATTTIEELIERKRDGERHSREEIERLVHGYVTGEVPDYQMSAWLMAVYFRGLDADETVDLTRAMTESGRVLDLTDVPGRVVDKHSTGGVADTTTLVVAPLVASCGVPVVKMSGRGLGHTGGTLDKLDAIPGFRTAFSAEQMVKIAQVTGIVVAAQTDDIDPADKKMYALRDVTATVPSVPLIVGSIISKKVAGGAAAILLDVKAGSGAFMKTAEEAVALAGELVRVGRSLGAETHAVITDMDEPLGSAVGNALEVREAIETLRGRGPERLTELCLEIASRMVLLGGHACDRSEARVMVGEALAEGVALETFRRWVAAQGGNPAIVDDPGLLALAPEQRVVAAPRSGYVSAIAAEEIGRTAMQLGAGRATKDDVIDLGAGVQLHAQVGTRLTAGEPLATLYTSNEALLDAAEERLLAAIGLSTAPVEPRPLVLGEEEGV